MLLSRTEGKRGGEDEENSSNNYNNKKMGIANGHLEIIWVYIYTVVGQFTGGRKRRNPASPQYTHL